MSEAELVTQIKKERKEAIDRSDKIKVAEFLNKPQKQQNKPVICEKSTGKAIIMLFLMFIIMVATIGITYSIIKLTEQQTRIVIQKEIQKETIIEQPIINEIHKEVTFISKTENIIKGDKGMVCIGTRNSTKMTCYKESDPNE